MSPFFFEFHTRFGSRLSWFPRKRRGIPKRPWSNEFGFERTYQANVLRTSLNSVLFGRFRSGDSLPAFSNSSAFVDQQRRIATIIDDLRWALSIAKIKSLSRCRPNIPRAFHPSRQKLQHALGSGSGSTVPSLPTTDSGSG